MIQDRPPWQAEKFQEESDKEERDFIANYIGIGKFNKALKSSTYFIREEGELIGMICVNTDEAVFDTL